MHRCLITGCGGFIGSHLAELLIEEGLEVRGLVHRQTVHLDNLGGRLRVLSCDILDREGIEAVVAEVRPDVVFHLAARSLIPESWEDPETTFRVNALGTLYLLEAVRKVNIDATVVVAGSSAEYGFSRENEIPIREERELRPASPYGVSKVATSLWTSFYHRAHGMSTITVRPFQLIGPRKYPDACSQFARSIVEIEQGKRNALDVGNLEAVRDVTDVRDGVAAIRLLAEKGTPGQVYNICSGKGYRIGELLDIFIALAARPIAFRQDPQRLRPADEEIIVGDNSKLRSLGWSPKIPIERTLADVLEYWRKEGAAVTGGVS